MWPVFTDKSHIKRAGLADIERSRAGACVGIARVYDGRWPQLDCIYGRLCHMEGWPIREIAPGVQLQLIGPDTDEPLISPFDWLHDLGDRWQRQKALKVLATFQRNRNLLMGWLEEAHSVLFDIKLARCEERIAALEQLGASPNEQLELAHLVDQLHSRCRSTFEATHPLVHQEPLDILLRLHNTPKGHAFVASYLPQLEKVLFNLADAVQAMGRDVQLIATSVAELTAFMGRVVNLPTWRKMGGVAFENFIIARLRMQGFEAHGTKHSGDEGIDIVAVLRSQPVGGCLVGSPSDGARYLFQCKRYNADHHVGQPAIRDFYGSVQAYDPSARGVFICTSSFSAPAITYAEKMGIELVDGRTLDQRLGFAIPMQGRATHASA